MAFKLGKMLKAVRQADLVITPRHNQFLLEGRADEPLRPEVMAEIAKQLTTQPRVRHGSFSSSSAGMCERRQVLSYLGVPTPLSVIDPQLANIFSDGRWRHLRWQALLLQQNLVNEIEVPLDWPNMRSRGTMDGAGIVYPEHRRWAGAEFGWELKGMNPFVFARMMKNDDWKDEHKRQVHRYFLSGGMDIFVVLYENKANNEWFEWVVEPDKKYMLEAEQELERLNKSADNERLPKVLPQCQLQTGPLWNDCPFGGHPKAGCLNSGKWPSLKKRAF